MPEVQYMGKGAAIWKRRDAVTRKMQGTHDRKKTMSGLRIARDHRRS